MQFLHVTCLVSKKVFAQIKVAVLRDSPEYRAGAGGLLRLTSIIGVLREQRSHVGYDCLAMLLPLVGAQAVSGTQEASARRSLCFLLRARTRSPWGYRPTVAASELSLFQMYEFVFGIICL